MTIGRTTIITEYHSPDWEYYVSIRRDGRRTAKWAKSSNFSLDEILNENIKEVGV